MSNCLEIGRNRRLCGGAIEYETTIESLRAQLAEAQRGDTMLIEDLNHQIAAWKESAGLAETKLAEAQRERDKLREFVAPMDKGPWRASNDGRVLYSDDFERDVCLHINGDFAGLPDRKAYAAWLAQQLNRAAAMLEKRAAVGD